MIASRSSIRTLALSALGAAWIISAAACGSNTPTAPSVNVPFSSEDVRVGTGAEAVAGRTLIVDYTGWLYDPTKAENKGVIFDTSIGRGVFSFRLGAGNVIPGWDQGMVGARVGGRRRLVIPPALGYGSTANGSIPGNSTLIFEVDLLAVQ